MAGWQDLALYALDPAAYILYQGFRLGYTQED
jgi:hypothetical protein